MAAPNLLETGIYTVSEAANLVRATERQVRGWIGGYPDSAKAAVIENELGWIDGKLAFSFTNLMELRFIAFFANAGVNLRTIRAIISEVRETLEQPHPFSTNIVFRTDGRKIVAEIARRNGVLDLYDLHSRNYEMGIVVYNSLKDGVVYDPRGKAMAWFPFQDIAPNVVIHPKYAFGRPVLRDSRIPTETLVKAVHVEGSEAAVAAWYEISQKRVQEAVRFENKLRRAA